MDGGPIPDSRRISAFTSVPLSGPKSGTCATSGRGASRSDINTTPRVAKPSGWVYPVEWSWVRAAAGRSAPHRQRPRSVALSTSAKTIEEVTNRAYPYGFVTPIESESTPPGLSEDIIRLISAKKNEPAFMLDWRRRTYRYWTAMRRAAGETRWEKRSYPPAGH